MTIYIQIKVTQQDNNQYKILIIKAQQTMSINPQKRIKTQTNDFQEVFDKKDRKQKLDKSSAVLRQHKQSEAHLKSVSKDITPKKHSITVQRSKFKESCSSHKKMSRNKQLTSVCSYSAIEKQSVPATKRKASNARSVKKKFSKNKQIHQSLKTTVSNFSILTKCLTEYIKEEKKKGNDPSLQILHLIKAFNKSEVAPLSKQLESLISHMLDYIEDTVGPTQQQVKDKTHGLKSRSSFSSASQREVAYSQILQNSHIPSTIKKPQKENSMDMNEQNFKKSYTYNDEKIRSCESNELDEQNREEPEVHESKKKGNKSFQKELKKDLQNMHDQLYQLKSAGEKLQIKAETQNEEKKKFEELYKKNKQLIENMKQKKSQNIQFSLSNNKLNADPNSSEEDDNY